MTKQGLGLTATLAALTALLSLYFYLRLTYAITLTISPNTTTGPIQWRLSTCRHTLPLAAVTITALLLLPITPAVVALLAP